jgi:hypothetical protein
MYSVVQRLRRPLVYVAVCGLAGFFVAGCTALSFTYNHADRLLLWRIDRYFHLSREQEGLVENRLATLHSWHRNVELPRYVEFLQQIHERWRDGLTPEEVDAIFDTFQKLRADLAQRVASEGAALLTTVDSQQIRHLERVVQRDNRDVQAEVRARPEDRATKRLNRVLSWLRDWLGVLTPDQERRIGVIVRALPDTTEQWADHRLQRQHEFVQLLRSRPVPGVLRQNIEDWLATPEKNSSADYMELTQHFRHDLKNAILEIDRTVTPRQRAYAAEKLRRLTREIQVLTER